MVFNFIMLILFGYFFGNISTAKILSKFKKDDITKHGSGNPGTMNMMRTFGFISGAATLLLDAIKSAVPSLIGYYMFKGAGMEYIGLFVGGASAVVGHCYPAIYKFKGGKGVACMVGIFAVAEPYWALGVFVFCFIYLCIFDYGVITSFLFITVLTVVEAIRFKTNPPIVIILFILYVLIFFMHRKNIERLLLGKENKVNFMDKLKKIGKGKKSKKEDKDREIG